MKTIKIKTPAKINLTLEVLNKRSDGYHNIESIMQAVSLFDIIMISTTDIPETHNIIEITGDNPLIPYDNTNLAYISAEKFLKATNITSLKIKIHIEKHIPVAAGLAGGSSNAAGVLVGLNLLFNNVLSTEIISKIASEIGSDVCFCLQGGTQVAKSRGEVLEQIPTPDLNLVIAKPKNLGISAKEAYVKFSEIADKPEYVGTAPMLDSIKENNSFKIANLINNSLELGILNDYPQIQGLKNSFIKNNCIKSLMSGSGPSVFGIYTENFDILELNNAENDIFIVKTITNGVSPV